jgi:hypothetical protein
MNGYRASSQNSGKTAGEPTVANNAKTTVLGSLGRVRKTPENCEPSGVESRAVAGGDLRFWIDLNSEQPKERGTDPVCFSHLLFDSPSCYMCWTMRRLFGRLPADQELRVFVDAVTKIEKMCVGNSVGVVKQREKAATN